jgi:hypothetical protein
MKYILLAIDELAATAQVYKFQGTALDLLLDIKSILVRRRVDWFVVIPEVYYKKLIPFLVSSQGRRELIRAIDDARLSGELMGIGDFIVFEAYRILQELDLYTIRFYPHGKYMRCRDYELLEFVFLTIIFLGKKRKIRIVLEDISADDAWFHTLGDIPFEELKISIEQFAEKVCKLYEKYKLRES